MKNIFILLIILTMVHTTNAQSNNNITGSYGLGSGGPEGRAHLLVFEDSTYAIVYFGGMLSGKWKLTQDNIYQFTPTKKGVYELYGRHDKNLVDETRISFYGFEEGSTFISLEAPKDEIYSMKRVFNIGANGFSYPYVNTFKRKENTISLMYKDHDLSNMITYNNKEGYNDFLAFFNGQNYERESQVFFASFKDNSLYFEENDISQRQPFDKDDEEIEMIRTMAAEMMNREVFYLNPSYNHFEGDINQGYVYNKEKEAYIIEQYYKEGDELLKTEQSYDSMIVIYAFKALEGFASEVLNYKIDEDVIFEVNP